MHQRQRDRLEDGLQVVDRDHTAHGGRRGAGHRDADLGGRQEPLRVLLKGLDETGLDVLLLDQLLDSTAPRVDDGQLSAGKEAVQENEDADGDKL